MRDRRLGELDLIDITSFARDGSTRSVHGYRAIVLCGLEDYSRESGQPLTKHIIVEVVAGPRPA